MSYTTIVNIKEDNTNESIIELKNSWGSATVIWSEFCKEYMGIDNKKTILSDSDYDRLWTKYKDSSIPIHHRAVLMMTYDGAYVDKKDFKRAESDIRKCLFDLLYDYDKLAVNHWPKIADVFKKDQGYHRIGLWCTSVCENPFNGEWNEELEEYEPIDNDSIFNLYEELDNYE